MTLHAALTMPSYRSPIAIPNLRLNDRSVGLYARRPLSRRESHRCLIFLVRSTHPSLLEGPDVLDERPPVVLGQVPPGRHGAPAGADLPEQLPVGLVLDTLEVQSAGLGFSATAAAPSPLPLLPWQDTQLTLATFSPCSATFALGAIGLFLAFSDAGAVQGVWPQAVPARASPNPAIRTRLRRLSDDIDSLLGRDTGLRTAWRRAAAAGMTTVIEPGPPRPALTAGVSGRSGCRRTRWPGPSRRRSARAGLDVLADEDGGGIQHLLLAEGVERQRLGEADRRRLLLPPAGGGQPAQRPDHRLVLVEHLRQLGAQAIGHGQHRSHLGRRRSRGEGGEQPERRQRVRLLLDEVGMEHGGNRPRRLSDLAAHPR